MNRKKDSLCKEPLTSSLVRMLQVWTDMTLQRCLTGVTFWAHCCLGLAGVIALLVGEPSGQSGAVTLWIRFKSACPGFCHHFASLWEWYWAGDGWCLATLETAAKYFNDGFIRLENWVSHNVRVLLVCFYKLQMSLQRSEERQSFCPIELCSDLCPSGTFSHIPQRSLKLSHRHMWALGHVFYPNPPHPQCSVRWSGLAVLSESVQILLKSESFLAYLWIRLTAKYQTNHICILVIDTNIRR